MPCTQEDFLVICKQKFVLQIFEMLVQNQNEFVVILLPHQTEEMSSPSLSISKMWVTV